MSTEDAKKRDPPATVYEVKISLGGDASLSWEPTLVVTDDLGTVFQWAVEYGLDIESEFSFDVICRRTSLVEARRIGRMRAEQEGLRFISLWASLNDMGPPL